MSRILAIASVGVLALGVACAKTRDANVQPVKTQDKVRPSADKQGMCTQDVINDFEDLKTYLGSGHQGEAWKATVVEHCRFFEERYGNKVNCVILPDTQISTPIVKDICNKAVQN